MFLSYPYRLYPFPAQESELRRWLSELTFLWNYSVEERTDAWRLRHERRTYLDQQARLKAWRAYDRAGLGSLPYDIARDQLQRVDLAFRAFFRPGADGRRGPRRPGYPRAHRRTDSFTFVTIRAPPTLRDRTHDCPCGLRLDRDVNAARNLLARALALDSPSELPRNPREVTRGERSPPPQRAGRRVYPRRRATSSNREHATRHESASTLSVPRT